MKSPRRAAGDAGARDIGIVGLAVAFLISLVRKMRLSTGGGRRVQHGIHRGQVGLGDGVFHLLKSRRLFLLWHGIDGHVGGAIQEHAGSGLSREIGVNQW